MKIIPIDPIETIYGKLSEHGNWYFRRSKKTGNIYVCRCPDRSKHVKTPQEVRNQQRFVQQFAHKKNNNH